MNDITKFSGGSAVSYVDIVKNKNISEAEKIATSYIKYIEKRYEKAIKSAIENDVHCRRIVLQAHFKRIRKKNLFNDVNNIVSRHFQALSFDVSLHQDASCPCPFNRICNNVEVRIMW